MTQKVAVVSVLALIMGAYFGALALAGYFDWKERRKRGEPPRYDERQRLVRLRAGNHALAVLTAFLIVWAVVDWMGLFTWTEDIWSMVLCALLLAWGVWAADCILHDGFTGWKQRGASNLLALTVTSGLLSITRPGLCGSWFPFLFASADFLLLSGVVLYQYRMEKRAQQRAGEGGE